MMLEVVVESFEEDRAPRRMKFHLEGASSFFTGVQRTDDHEQTAIKFEGKVVA